VSYAGYVAVWQNLMYVIFIYLLVSVPKHWGSITDGWMIVGYG